MSWLGSRAPSKAPWHVSRVLAWLTGEHHARPRPTLAWLARHQARPRGTLAWLAGGHHARPRATLAWLACTKQGPVARVACLGLARGRAPCKAPCHLGLARGRAPSKASCHLGLARGRAPSKAPWHASRVLAWLVGGHQARPCGTLAWLAGGHHARPRATLAWLAGTKQGPMARVACLGLARGRAPCKVSCHLGLARGHQARPRGTRRVSWLVSRAGTKQVPVARVACLGLPRERAPSKAPCHLGLARGHQARPRATLA